MNNVDTTVDTPTTREEYIIASLFWLFYLITSSFIIYSIGACLQ